MISVACSLPAPRAGCRRLQGSPEGASMSMLGTRFASFHDAAARALAHLPKESLANDTALVLLFDATPWWRFHDEALPLLSPAEGERSRRFRHARHRDTYVLAHALWRHALGAVLRQ